MGVLCPQPLFHLLHLTKKSRSNYVNDPNPTEYVPLYKGCHFDDRDWSSLLKLWDSFRFRLRYFVNVIVSKCVSSIASNYKTGE